MLKDTVRARLPKAAQQELDRLQASLDYWREKYELAVGQTDTPSRVSVSEVDREVYLDHAARIQLRTGGDYDYVEVHLQGDETHGYTVSVRAGASQLVVRPQSGNAIVVYPESR